MKIYKQVVALIFFLSLTGLSGYAAVQDSVGTKVKNGKIFILHQVEKSQGLFAISRRYGVSLNDIIVANPGSDKILHVDQVLMIPTGKDAQLEEKAVTNYFAEDKVPSQSSEKLESRKTTFAKYHTVAEGETLYSISVLYKTKVDVLKNLNNLNSDLLSLGQRLMVPATENEHADHQDNIGLTEKELQDATNKLEQVKKASNTKKFKENPVVEMSEVVAEKYSISIEKVAKYNIEKVSETGFAELLPEDDANIGNRVCSHHSAAIGSTIMVTNPTINKSVFVKVISNHTLSKTTGNIIKLSLTASSDIELINNAAVQVSFAR